MNNYQSDSGRPNARGKILATVMAPIAALTLAACAGDTSGAAESDEPSAPTKTEKVVAEEELNDHATRFYYDDGTALTEFYYYSGDWNHRNKLGRGVLSMCDGGDLLDISRQDESISRIPDHAACTNGRLEPNDFIRVR